ncbi:hypothetical protein [Pelotomaculum propionicicum]|mgnify:CR=1 FL=1|uniref:Uncharacterized protein n=1 Tax=Pelotomaculum propionicicum TaxID=258475 RepID=A0A4Y7RNB7_9FIRM|nr:hypothetical protein [Pelotomaculum propionicicum]NLI12638.1 hypothetical protein [Peptococcaceae bacterium]TEB09787.1 hypothetical protein Pmgp_02883 [Pelotomaculum propionicicum]
MADKSQKNLVVFNYQNNETKYYFLTGGSGYPLADFMPLSALGEGGAAAGLVVAEKIQKTTNTVPWTDIPNLELKQ